MSASHNLPPWLRGQVVSSTFATEETGAMGREIESRQGYRAIAFLKAPTFPLINMHTYICICVGYVCRVIVLKKAPTCHLINIHTCIRIYVYVYM
jgi:hypothetical protein